MSALAQLLAGALGAGGPPRIGPGPQSMHPPQGMPGQSPAPQMAGRLPQMAPPPPQMGGAPPLPGVAPKAPPPMGPKPPTSRGAPVSAKEPPVASPKHADVESKAEDRTEKPGDEESEDTMMGAAKKALAPKGKSEFKPKTAAKDKGKK